MGEYMGVCLPSCSKRNMDRCPNSITSINLKQQFVSIEYPGLVEKEDAAIKTMGGILAMSTAHCQANRKIELRFRPADPFCKPTYGERLQTSNLLIKVVKRTIRNKKTLAEEISYEIHVEGVIVSTYKFTGLCDFQYLPMEKIDQSAVKENGDLFVSIIDQVVPQKLTTVDWLEGPGPVFMSPPVFSRMDVPVEYYFRKDPNPLPPSDANVIGRLRKRRTLQGIFLNFEAPTIPEKPREVAVRNLAVRFIKKDDVDLIRKLFDERPVWTKAGLAFFAQNIENSAMKFILAASAYYFTTGPWRNAWVRFGYDPREDVNARNYQILDYRIIHNYKSKVTPKRSYTSYTQPHKFVSSFRTKASSIRQNPEASGTTEATGRSEVSYAYRPGVIPECRQMFYQYCDLHVPEIQEMLNVANLNDICDERHGWYPPNIEEDCRKILNKHIVKAFGQEKWKKKKTDDDEEGEEDEEEDEDEADEGDEADDADDGNEYPQEEEPPETYLQESDDEFSSSEEEP